MITKEDIKKTVKNHYPITLYFSRHNHQILKEIRDYNKPCEVDDIKYIRKEQVDRLIKAAEQRGYKEARIKYGGKI